jgi:hypothetical protein
MVTETNDVEMKSVDDAAGSSSNGDSAAAAEAKKDPDLLSVDGKYSKSNYYWWV